MTIIELLVALSIFIILTGITIFDYGSFRSTVGTENLVNDIALSVRKAQSYAIGVRGISSSFENGYGISFVTRDLTSNPLSGSNKSFIIFTDSNNSRSYDIPTGVCGDSNECREILSINGIDRISAIYLEDNKKIDVNGRLDIVFKRPNPDALFCYRPDGVNSACPQGASSSYVKIEVSNGESAKTVTIWNTGQIGIE